MTDKCDLKECPSYDDTCVCCCRDFVFSIKLGNCAFKKGRENMLQEITSELNTLAHDSRHSARDMHGIELVIQKIKER